MMHCRAVARSTQRRMAPFSIQGLAKNWEKPQAWEVFERKEACVEFSVEEFSARGTPLHSRVRFRAEVADNHPFVFAALAGSLPLCLIVKCETDAGEGDNRQKTPAVHKGSHPGHIPQSFPAFTEREWYHFFPAGETVGPHDVFEVPPGWCNGRCKTGAMDDCKPKFLDRSLIWNRQEDQTTYLIKKGGWCKSSKREILRDFSPPQQTIAQTFTKRHNKGGAPGLEITSSTDDELAQHICVATSELRLIQQHGPWIKKPDLDRIVLQRILWSPRTLSKSEIESIISRDYNKGFSTGFEAPVFCDAETKRNKLNGGCGNVFWVENPVKSVPGRPHVHVFYVVKGMEDEVFTTSYERCSWRDIITGQNGANGEHTPWDAFATCFRSRGAFWSLRATQPKLMETYDKKFFNSLNGSQATSPGDCVSSYPQMLPAEKRGIEMDYVETGALFEADPEKLVSARGERTYQLTKPMVCDAQCDMRKKTEYKPFGSSQEYWDFVAWRQRKHRRGLAGQSV